MWPTCRRRRGARRAAACPAALNVRGARRYARRQFGWFRQEPAFLWLRQGPRLVERLDALAGMDPPGFERELRAQGASAPLLEMRAPVELGEHRNYKSALHVYGRPDAVERQLQMIAAALDSVR